PRSTHRRPFRQLVWSLSVRQAKTNASLSPHQLRGSSSSILPTPLPRVPDTQASPSQTVRPSDWSTVPRFADNSAGVPTQILSPRCRLVAEPSLIQFRSLTARAPRAPGTLPKSTAPSRPRRGTLAEPDVPSAKEAIGNTWPSGSGGLDICP